MTLRARLVLLYTAIAGGIILLFGAIVYIVVNFTLAEQMDDALAQATYEIAAITKVDQQGELTLVTFPALDFTAGVYVQVWDRYGRLVRNSPNLSPEYKQPLDESGLRAGLRSNEPVYKDIQTGNYGLRVLTTPLVLSGRLVGVLQVGSPLDVIKKTQGVLIPALLVATIIAMALAALAGWVTITQALSSVESVTQTALQITRADDLSMRIPYQGPPNDEVGQLIRAFNQTLERLENLFNSQRRFLADVGHELRTPLTVIKGNVDLMRKMNSTDKESMESIESEVDRLIRLVGDLLLLAQAESGKLPLARQTVELDTILLEVLQQMRVLARDRLQMRLGEIDQVLVCGDQDRLKQVIVNLIGNAIKYTPAGGEVIVGLGKLEDRARLTVSDSGPGIPVEDMAHIFERFYRGEKSRTRSRDGKGFGLGLSIAYWIVRNHGGQIDVAPREPQGTTFCVWLPLAHGNCLEEIQLQERLDKNV